jgi:hypothetical protein
MNGPQPTQAKDNAHLAGELAASSELLAMHISMHARQAELSRRCARSNRTRALYRRIHDTRQVTAERASRQSGLLRRSERVLEELADALTESSAASEVTRPPRP